MKKYFLYILILIALVGIFSPIFKSLAQTPEPDTNYHLLAPLPCDPNASNPDCNVGNLTTFNPAQKNPLSGYLNLMIHIFIGLCAVLAMVMIVKGGIEYMTTELISGKEAGKETIIHAIFGLLLALGAWTILNQINPALLNTDLSSLQSVTVKVDLKNESVPQTPTMVNGKLSYGGYPVGSNFAADFPQNSVATLPAGVTLNKTPCVNVGDTNCTSVLGLDPSIVNSIKSGCNCSFVITGGTEFWLHGGATGNTDHHPGSSAVDISATSAINSYMSQGATTSFPKDGTLYSTSTTCYWAEAAGSTSSTTADHWHVYPKPSSGQC